MIKSSSNKQDQESHSLLEGDLDQLLAGLERQKEDLGPIADELIDLLRQPQPQDPMYKPKGHLA